MWVASGDSPVGDCEARSDKGSSVDSVWRHSLNADYPQRYELTQDRVHRKEVDGDHRSTLST